MTVEPGVEGHVHVVSIGVASYFWLNNRVEKIVGNTSRNRLKTKDHNSYYSCNDDKHTADPLSTHFPSTFSPLAPLSRSCRSIPSADHARSNSEARWLRDQTFITPTKDHQ